MRKLLTAIGLLFFTLTLLLASIRVLSNPSNNLVKRVLGFDTEFPSRACWYDICPSSTTIAQSVAQFTDNAQRLGTKVIYGTSTTASYTYLDWYAACVKFHAPEWQSCLLPYYGLEKSELRIYLELKDIHLALGDVVALIGSPTSVFMCSGIIPDGYGNRQGVVATLHFANGMVIEAYKASKYNPPVKPTPRDEWLLSPDMLLNTITYFPATTDTALADGTITFPWRGFSRGPERHYNCSL